MDKPCIVSESFSNDTHFCLKITFLFFNSAMVGFSALNASQLRFREPPQCSTTRQSVDTPFCAERASCSVPGQRRFDAMKPVTFHNIPLFNVEADMVASGPFIKVRGQSASSGGSSVGMDALVTSVTVKLLPNVSGGIVLQVVQGSSEQIPAKACRRSLTATMGREIVRVFAS
jgi:hypothetical protein